MKKNFSGDLRDIIFASIKEERFEAKITANENGVVVGIKKVVVKAEELGIDIETYVEDGDEVKVNEVLIKVIGDPKQLALAEDHLMGLLGKYSGIVTAARKAKELAGKRLKVVSGGWKKMPGVLKRSLREAIKLGGLTPRMTNKPFIYLDKNYVRMFGGIEETLLAVGSIDRASVIQVKGEFKSIAEEVLAAANNGAEVIMVDTGILEDCHTASQVLREEDLRDDVKLAFGGGIKISEIPQLRDEDIEIIDVGREIVDAPLLDLSFDVIFE